LKVTILRIRYFTTWRAEFYSFIFLSDGHRRAICTNRSAKRLTITKQKMALLCQRQSERMYMLELKYACSYQTPVTIFLMTSTPRRRFFKIVTFVVHVVAVVLFFQMSMAVKRKAREIILRRTTFSKKW